MGTDHEERREILGFWVMGLIGESPMPGWRPSSGSGKGGVKRIDIVVSDDLSGIEEASRSVFPGADHQLCCVHAVRNASSKVMDFDCSEVLYDIKTVYRAGGEGEAELALSSLEKRCKKRYPSLLSYWLESFSHLTSFLKYHEQVRPYIYTTSQLERIEKEVKRWTKTIEVFSDESHISIL